MTWSPPNSCVSQVSCGRHHTLFLTASGKVYSCGSNDNGQLGHELATKRPRMSLSIFSMYLKSHLQSALTLINI